MCSCVGLCPPGSPWKCDRSHTADGLLHGNNHNVPAEIEVRGINNNKLHGRVLNSCFVFRRSQVQTSACKYMTLTEVRDFVQTLQANAKVVYEVRPRPLPSTCVTIRQSTIRITEFHKETDTTRLRHPVYNDRTELFPAYIC